MEPAIAIGRLVILIFSVIVHECSHGVAALRNGDDTARIMGRLTLNPLPHIDIFGTIIIPGLLLLSNAGVIFGWAKPVPVNPYRFRNFRRGMIEVGLSGPLSNILLALFFAFLLRITGANSLSGVSGLLLFGVAINFVLALFNLIPIPPLDGSRILGSLLPLKMEAKYYRIERYGMFIIIALLFFGFFDLLFPVISFLVKLVTGASLS
ncbi:MAG: site-2 protease family protein [Candidatus Omnitrophica bacterium]|nr:site-2 protease family protein [Candidatus Omnitrophota bacterium]